MRQLFRNLQSPLPSDQLISEGNEPPKSDTFATTTKSPVHKGLRIITGCFLLTLSLIAIGIISVFLDETFVSWWIPSGIGLVCAGPFAWLSYRMFRWISGTDRVWLNWVMGTIFWVAVCTCGILTVNFVTAQNGECTSVKGEVVHKQRLTKKQTRRVGRRHYVTDKVYYVYELTTRLPDNREITLPVSLEVYNHIRTGQSLTVPLTKGVFGWEVVNPHDITYPSPRKRPYSPRKINPAINSES